MIMALGSGIGSSLAPNDRKEQLKFWQLTVFTWRLHTAPATLERQRVITFSTARPIHRRPTAIAGFANSTQETFFAPADHGFTGWGSYRLGLLHRSPRSQTAQQGQPSGFVPGKSLFRLAGYSDEHLLWNCLMSNRVR